MGIVQKIRNGGVAAVLTLAGGGWVLRDEIHYLFRPTVLETVAMIGGTVGAAAWVRKATRKGEAQPVESAESVHATIEQDAPAERVRKVREALPPAQPVEYARFEQTTRAAKRVVGL